MGDEGGGMSRGGACPGGGHVPHVWQWGGGEGREYLMSFPTFCDGKKSHISILFAFYGHIYWTYPDHMLSISTYIFRYSEHVQYIG